MVTSKIENSPNKSLLNSKIQITKPVINSNIPFSLKSMKDQKYKDNIVTKTLNINKEDSKKEKSINKPRIQSRIRKRTSLKAHNIKDASSKQTNNPKTKHKHEKS